MAKNQTPTAQSPAGDPSSGESGPRQSPRGRRLRAFGLLSSIAILAVGTALQVAEPPLVASLRNQVFDAYQRSRPRPYEATPVRIVDIDEESLAKLGQWPWPRPLIGDLVGKLREFGAASVAFDILFSEPDRTSPHWLASEWARRGQVPADLAAALEKLPDNDTVFAADLALGKVVTAFALTETPEGQRLPVNKARWVRVGTDGALPLSRYEGSVASLSAFENAAAGSGAINFSPDRDGVVRRVPLLAQLGEQIYPSLFVEALRVAEEAGNYAVSADPDPRTGSARMTALRVGKTSLPTDSNGRMWAYLTAPTPQRYVSAWEVLDGRARDRIPAGAIVFIGSSATGLKDLRFSALGRVLPGVEIHAQLTEQALLGVFVSRPSWIVGLEMLIVLASWVLMLIYGARGRTLPIAVAAIVAVLTEVAASSYFWNTHNILFDPLTPSLVMAAAFLAYVVPGQIAAEREQRWIRGVFSNYLSPNLVEHLIHNPADLKLGGERRECSFVLTDVAGFTTMVESTDPAELTDVINNYLDEMVGIAFKHDGTLDRIVGDAIAVLFSAPVTQKDHAARAVRCALEMDAFAKTYSKDLQAQGVAFGTTRIGVHTGEVVVGNFGGSTHFDYRPLGDPINTAARLETANRHLGTRVCVSGTTVAACKDFRGRPAGHLVLKGKTIPVEVFEPLSSAEASSALMIDYTRAFAQLDAEPEAAVETFQTLSQRYPQDPLIAFHRKRLESGERGSVVVMSEK